MSDDMTKYWLKRVSNCNLRRDCLECDNHSKCLDDFIKKTRESSEEVIDGITPFALKGDA
jgi:hypothetical protein